MALGLAAVGKPFTADDLPLPLDSFVKGGGAAFLILVPLWAGSLYWHLQAGARISQAGIILLLFAREAITFAYGEIGTDEKRG